MEAVRLRIKDVDLQMNQITLRSGKGDKDRFTTLASAVIPLLEVQIQGWAYCIVRIWPADMARCICRTRWSGSIQTPQKIWGGNTFFPRGRFPLTHGPGRYGAITWTQAPS